MHVGSSISHYRIVEKLGEGGMGVVYKAQDTTLDRPVALKFLAQHLLDDAEAKERFLREAKAAAGIDHPNICHVYEIGEENEKTFIAMAFVEGENLEARIAKGPLAIKDALDIARQVADGLQAAHEKNVVHRDIKPANILIDPKGRATIMDFGLARLTEASRLTKMDTAMGTVAYMSPEQAQGMDVDSRSDIWALGCVLYEMVSGQRPFKGVYDQALLYEIVHEQVAPLTSIRAGVPMELEFITGKCLAKDRDDRTSTAHEVSRDLRTLAEKLKSGHSTILRTSAMTGAVPATMTGAHTLNPAATLPPDAVVIAKRRLLAVYGLAAATTLATLVLAFFYFTQAPPSQPTRRFSFAAPSLDSNPVGASLALSPDSLHIAYTTKEATGGVWVQDLDQDEPRQLAGTEGAVLPFWSPDGQFIAYAARGELRKISLQGGASGLICPLPGANFMGGAWSPDGASIFFSALGGQGPIYRTSVQDGTAEQVIASREFDETAPISGWPHFVSNSADQILLFAIGTPTSSNIYVKNFKTGQSAALGPGDHPIYSAATGHLIYQAQRRVPDLWVRPFSPETLRFTGSAFPLRQNARQPSVSDDGTLAYLDGSVGGSQTLVWLSRTGELIQAVGQPQPDIAQPALSPDGQRAAVRSSESGNLDVWIHDFVRSAKTRLTFEDETEANPAWSPSGREIAYRLERAPNRIMLRSADGTGNAAVLVEAPSSLFYPEWSRDGRYLAYEDSSPGTQSDIRYVELSADGKVGDPVTFVGAPSDQQLPKFSPDGGFLAYTSNESGRSEVYVRSFPGGDGKWQASVNGGTLPRWRRDGKELYYVAGDTLMAVSVSRNSTITLGRPQRLFDVPGIGLGGGAFGGYDVAGDGQRFLAVAPVEGPNAVVPKIRVVQNWYEEFRNREQ